MLTPVQKIASITWKGDSLRGPPARAPPDDGRDQNYEMSSAGQKRDGQACAKSCNADEPKKEAQNNSGKFRKRLTQNKYASRVLNKVGGNDSRFTHSQEKVHLSFGALAYRPSNEPAGGTTTVLQHFLDKKKFTLPVPGNAVPIDLSQADGVPLFEDETYMCVRESSLELSGCSYGRIVDQHQMLEALATGMITAILMIMDVTSDIYFALSLWQNPLYAAIPIEQKLGFVALLLLGNVLWVGISCYLALRYKRHYVHDSGRATWFTFFTNHGYLCMCYLFNMPTFLLVLGKRLIKVSMVKDGKNRNAVFLLAYDDKVDYDTKSTYGLLGHLPSFVFEDLPSVAFNVWFMVQTRHMDFISVASLFFSTIGCIIKGREVGMWMVARYVTCRRNISEPQSSSVT